MRHCSEQLEFSGHVGMRPGDTMKTMTAYNPVLTAMKTPHVVVACMVMVAMLLMSCSAKESTNDSARNLAKVEALSGQSDATQKQPGMNNAAKDVLFEDPMTANWQEHWFLDGKLATLEHRDGGLYFSGGTITKEQDKEQYHAHHAVLWTKQVFEGDLLISFEMTRVDTSNYGNTLLYIQAQGIGTPPYVEDIHAWKDMRAIPAMNKYFTYMSLLSVSFRENLRCKRYPLQDTAGNQFDGALFQPMEDYAGITPGKTYLVEVEKKNPHLTLRLYDAANKMLVKECRWDVSRNPEAQMPRLIQKGRIGLRHMSTKQFIYRNFTVKRL